MSEREQGDRGRTPAEGDGGRRESSGMSAAGRTEADDEGVLTLVCFKCGTEYYFSEGEPPSEMSCEKCGNTVFRSFYSSEGDEAADDFRDSTERDMDPDDAEGETLPGDISDLNRG